MKNKIKIMGEHKNADLIMNNAFWLGVWPGIDTGQRKYIINAVERFLSNYNKV